MSLIQLSSAWHAMTHYWQIRSHKPACHQHLDDDWLESLDDCRKSTCVCLSAFYICLKHLWGRVGSTDGFFPRKPALKRLASAVRRTSYWTFVVQPTRVVWAKERKNVSCERTVCRHDPTSEYVCFLRGSLHCELVNLVRWSAKIQKQACWEHVQQLISSCIGLLVRKLSCNLTVGYV